MVLFPVEKVSISGPTLAALLHSFSAAASDVDGLLFGHANPLPPPDLHDDDLNPTPTSAADPPSSPLGVTVTGHCCFATPMSFYDAVGRVDAAALSRSAAADHPLLGWFSGRRHSPLRPSMREYSVSVSLSGIIESRDTDPNPRFRSPCVFLLLSASQAGNRAVHTHEYRAFELRKVGDGKEFKDCRFVPRSLSVVNVGPAFRGHYGLFSPDSGFPLLASGTDGKGEGDGKSLIGIRNQQVLDRVTEGYDVERLGQMVGSGAVQYRTELEGLYGNMLQKLDSLGSLVEEGSNKVFEQEKRNFKLRSKVAGLIN